MNIHPRRSEFAVLAVVWVLALIALGAAQAVAQTTPEFRAYWVDSFHAGFKSQSEVNTLFSTLRNSHMNAVVVQMRQRGDTYYPSTIEPWAPDANQSFDSLAAIINAAHNSSPRIQVYVWFCMMPIWNSQSAPSMSNHVYNQHPEWLTQTSSGTTWDGSNYCLDPGVPGVQQYTNDVIMDVVNRYDIDGIHYDYIRYSGNTVGYNPTAVARFNAQNNRTGTPSATDSTWLQWRRDQVTGIVRKIYANMLAAKPQCRSSASTICWGDGPTSDSGWYSSSAYASVLQDWRSWMQEGLIDMNMPMAYFDDSANASYFNHWCAFVKSHKYNRQGSIGMGSYLNTKTNVWAQVADTRSTATWNGSNYLGDGQLFYSYACPYGNTWGVAPSFATDLVANVYQNAVSVPDMPWKSTPTKGHIKGTVTYVGTQMDTVTVTLTGPENRTIKTDGNGFYAFIDLTPGNYTVSCTYNSIVTTTSALVTAGAITSANIALSTDTTPPVISSVRTDSITATTASVHWSTDDASSSQVDYGLTSSYGSTTTLDPTLVTSHTVALSGLLSARTYHYRVRSTNVVSLTSNSGDYTFTTAVDTTPPVISNVQVTNLTDTSATVTWTTDDLSTSQVQFGPSTAYGSATVEDMTYVTSHSVTVSGLTPNTVYHFRVKSTSSAPLTSYSADGMFLTLYSLIIDDLQGSGSGTWNSTITAGGWPIDNSEFLTAANDQSTATSTFTWTPNIPAAGGWDIYCWYPAGPDRSTQATYVVNYGSGRTWTAVVNQQATGSQWVKLASALSLTAGTGTNVQLTNKTPDATGTTVVVADAVKFVSKITDTTAPSTPTSLVVTASSPTEIDLTWNGSTDNVAVAGYKIYRNSVLCAVCSTPGFADTGLSPNTQYSYRVSAYDINNNESTQTGVVMRYTLALKPVVACNKLSGYWYSGSNNSFTFTNTGFGSGKATYYRVAWDNSPAHTWSGTDTTWSTTTTSYTASTNSSGWYFHANAYNGEGIGNPDDFDSDTYYFDNVAPVVTSVTPTWYVRKSGSTYDDLSAKWTATDSGSGPSQYQYCVGSSFGASDVVGWTSVGDSTGATCHLPNPAAYGKYFWSVKCTDAAGNTSAPVSSHASMYASVYQTLAAALNNPDDTAVIISPSLVVGGVIGPNSYVQEAKRNCGICLYYTDAGWQPGASVSIAGVLNTDTERSLTQVQCIYWESGTSAPVPLAMACASVGGFSPNMYTPALDGAVAIYNNGLLIKVAGTVTSHTTGSFVVDDGSGAPVTVISDKAVTDGSHVEATGISGFDWLGGDVRTRSQADVQIISP